MQDDSTFGDPAVQRPVSRLPLDRLASLYEGIFTVIVRVQSGKQPIQRIDQFRDRMKTVLSEVARAGAQRGYSAEDIAQANFAIIAFLDETVLTSSESGRTQWARKTLQEEMFQQRSAGEAFFQKLDQLSANRDSAELVQILEVYYLCLLLGYEGKYAVGSKGELFQLMTNLRERIERVSGRSIPLSPDTELEQPKSDPTPQNQADPLPRWTRLGAVAAIAFALICFIIFKLILSSRAGDLHSLIGSGVHSGT